MRLAILGFIFLVLAVPLAVEAQSPRVPRIGVLSPGTPGPSPLLDAFRQGLRELGYVEGQNIAFEYRFDDAKPARLSDLGAPQPIVTGNLKFDVTLPPAVLELGAGFRARFGASRPIWLA